MSHLKTFAISFAVAFATIAIVNRVAALKSIAYPTA
jgi:hypothetical protein